MKAQFLALALLVVGCAGDPPLSTGVQCEETSQCAEPLVCRLGRCRRECVAARDCGAGQLCLFDVDTKLGACRVEEETRCALNSDCPASLVCKSTGCTNGCTDDRDCSGSDECRVDPMGGSRCFPPDNCVYNSDCDDGLVCSADQVCQLECREDRDCAPGGRCDTCDPPLSCDRETQNRCIYPGDDA